MALSLRLRRVLTLSSSLLSRHLPSVPSSPASLIPNPNLNSLIRSRFFRSSPSSSFSSSFGRRSDGGFEDSKIGPDEILFEGCDYNHWLITVDFPKGDSRPTPEQMVETYVQTAAQVFGSVEEAKRRIYACSTTTYDGFQVVCDEATSEKFRGLPGVVFILPDSYIDPTNKQYGGDKYDNGVITPRPPPIQFGRQRYGDRNRNDRPRGSMPPQQGTETRGYNYGSPRQDRNGYGQGEHRDFAQAGGQVPPQSGFPQGQQGNAPPFQSGFPQQGNPPPFQSGFPQGQRGNPPPFRTGFPQGQRGNPPPFPTGFPQGQQGNPPPFQAGFSQGQQGNPPPFQTGFSQGQQGNPPRQEQMDYSQGPRGDNRSGPAPGYGGNHGQGSEPAEQRQPSPGYGENYGQGSGASGQFEQAPGAPDYRQR